MDERQTQVVSGAGLQESRINTEFVDFLSKWGPRALYVLLAVVLGFLGLQKWTKYQQRIRDQAFADYEAQVASRSPDLLLQVAQNHTKQNAVWSLASRDAANLLLQAALAGTAPGADPLAPQPEDRLSDDQKSAMLKRAETIYRDIIARNGAAEGHLIFTEQARWGLVSSLYSQGKSAEGAETLVQFIDAANEGDLPDLAAFGRSRLEAIKAEGEPPVIVSQSVLPPSEIRPTGVQIDRSTTTVIDPATGIQTTRIPLPNRQPTEDSPLPDDDTPSDDPGTSDPE